ncbi:hypothetical protein CDO73_01435 [Saccharibacillus sp. O23]|uniref:hypothetical protein n=1 Tax=Saccharibacillus sp. O23 TaxID=2009338 RepID=UPI000B4DFF2A|nr:hypothetical protein [Saccharibacillus sp. O23]OWR32299.1 hypothetical protein CDO73_01435 [Saccharibacillus sp. O23]
MTDKLITCKIVGVYKHALTRGKPYEIIDYANDKYRIIGDHGRRVWVSQLYFDMGKVLLLHMKEWKFDDEIKDWDIIEVTITFDNGTRRWCHMTTPEKLVEHFKNPMMDPPGFFMKHLIIMKSLEITEVEQTLRYLDSQGELEEATKPLE